MKVIVQNSYGSPDILEFKEISNPVSTEQEVFAACSSTLANLYM